ncbi:MAG: hypothetical protein IJJ00_04505 [Erysipelotrichaceae bacterium]|nr:hypothetical protein [Erysipelotrichaceae bacterium]
MKAHKLIILALAALLCLSACAKGGSTGNDEPVENNTPTEDTAVLLDGIGRGTINGSTYRNDYIGLGFTLPEGWFFYDDDQIAYINNMTKEKFEGTKVETALEESGQFTDMMAQSSNGTSNINVIITTGGTALKLYTDEQLFTMTQSIYEEQLAGSGMTIKDYQIKKTVKNGEEKTYLYMLVEMDGASFKEYQVYVRPGSDYVGIATITLAVDEDPEPYLERLDW